MGTTLSAADPAPALPRAAVDVGSNSLRLLVVDGAGAPQLRELAITRLGAGVDATGHLDDAALERTLETLAAFRDRWREHGVDDTAVRIAATSAVRDAADRERFFAGVRETCGVDAEVLTGEQEAALAHVGATGAVDVSEPALVIDVGGGSTELVVGAPGGGVAAGVSLQLGCVRLTERLLPGDPPAGDAVAAARAEVAARLDEAERRLAAAGAVPGEARSAIGVAGTATTLAALHLGLDEYRPEAIHGTRVPAPALRELTARLVAATAAERAAMGPVQAGREDVLHGGALVLSAIVERWGFAELVVSEADSLDGLAASAA